MTSTNLTSSGSTRKRHVPTRHDHIYYSVNADGTRVYEVREPHGNRLCKKAGSGTLEEAKAAANALYAPNAPRVTGSVTFAQAAKDWRETRTIRPSSAKRLDGILDRHVLPVLGREKVRDITTGHYTRVLGRVTPGSQKVTYSTMRIVLGHAVEMGALAVVPKLSRSKAPKAAPSRRRILSADEQTRLLMYAERIGRLSQVVRVAVTQGLRIGEAVGLEWEDISFSDGTMTVRRSVDKDGNVGPTKSGKERKIDLYPVARKALLELRSESATGRVFRNRDGAPWAYSDIDRAFGSAVKKAALQETEDGKVTFHALRHTCASRLANHPGVPLVQVQDFLGHADLSTTQGYVHRIESEKVTAAMAEALAA